MGLSLYRSQVGCPGLTVLQNRVQVMKNSTYILYKEKMIPFEVGENVGSIYLTKKKKVPLLSHPIRLSKESFHYSAPL